MGGGVGKAIGGICIGTKTIYNNKILLLEKPVNTAYTDLVKKNNIFIYSEISIKKITDLIRLSDIIIINWWGHPLMIRFLQKFPQTPCRCIIWNHINGRSYPYLPAVFLNKFSSIMFTSRYSLDNDMWKNERKNILEKSDIIYGMGDFSPNKIRPKTDYCHKSNFIIGYIGTIDYAKINRKFLDYYSSIISDIPNVKFCMLGHVTDEIKKDIIDRNLTEYFILPGYVGNIEKYIYDMDVYAYLLSPNNYATTENALLEAMAYALPIIVLNNGVESSIVKENISGYIVSDITEFREKMKCLYNEKNAKQIGRSARSFVIDEYSLEENVERFNSVCAKVMSQKKRIYDFEDILRDNAYDPFMLFAQNEGKKIKKIVEKNNKFDDIDISPIFYGEYKGSVYQYARYFPKDERMKKIINYFQKQGR